MRVGNTTSIELRCGGATFGTAGSCSTLGGGGNVSSGGGSGDSGTGLELAQACCPEGIAVGSGVCCGGGAGSLLSADTGATGAVSGGGSGKVTPVDPVELWAQAELLKATMARQASERIMTESRALADRIR